MTPLTLWFGWWMPFFGRWLCHQFFRGFCRVRHWNQWWFLKLFLAVFGKLIWISVLENYDQVQQLYNQADHLRSLPSLDGDQNRWSDHFIYLNMFVGPEIKYHLIFNFVIFRAVMFSSRGVFLGALDIFNFFAFPIFSKIVKKSSNFKFHVCSVQCCFSQ